MTTSSRKSIDTPAHRLASSPLTLSFTRIRSNPSRTKSKSESKAHVTPRNFLKELDEAKSSTKKKTRNTLEGSFMNSEIKKSQGNEIWEMKRITQGTLIDSDEEGTVSETNSENLSETNGLTPKEEIDKLLVLPSSESSSEDENEENSDDRSCGSVINLCDDETQKNSEGLHVPRTSPQFNISSRTVRRTNTNQINEYKITSFSSDENDVIIDSSEEDHIYDDIDYEPAENDSDEEELELKCLEPQSRRNSNRHVLEDTDEEAEVESEQVRKSFQRKKTKIEDYFKFCTKSQDTKNRKRLRQNKQKYSSKQEKSSTSDIIRIGETNTWFRENETPKPRTITANTDRNDVNGGSGAGLGGTLVMRQPEASDGDDCVVVPPPPKTRKRTTSTSRKSPQRKARTTTPKATRQQKSKNTFTTPKRRQIKAKASTADETVKKKRRFFKGRRFAYKNRQKKQPQTSSRSAWSNYEQGLGQFHGGKNNAYMSIAKQDPELRDFGGAKLVFN